jgi:hypothetical protein
MPIGIHAPESMAMMRNGASKDSFMDEATTSKLAPKHDAFSEVSVCPCLVVLNVVHARAVLDPVIFVALHYQLTTFS